jgi:hypothetical protein
LDHQRQLSAAIEAVGYRADRHPVIVEANQFMSLESYLALVVVPEINELAQEYQKWEQANDLAKEITPFPKNLFMEIYDVLVTLGNAIDFIAPKFSVEAMKANVNGQFHGNFDEMREQVLNLGVGNVERNLQSIFTILLSMLKHLDIDLQTEIYVRLVNSKLEGNKPSDLFQKEPGMNVADLLAKFTHVIAALRKLRTFLKNKTGREITLEPRLVKPFKNQFLDWQKSEVVLAQLPQDFADFYTQFRDEVSWLLTAGRRKKNPLSDEKTLVIKPPNNYRDLELNLLIAGGIPLQAPAENIVFAAPANARQTQGSNATLSQTIFWF